MKYKILESYTRDVGKGVVRADYDTMEKLKANTGDFVKVNGGSIFKILPLYPSDENKQIVRIDGLGRNNSKLKIGEKVTLKKVELETLSKITLTPLEAIPPIDERFLSDSLNTISVIVGDFVMIPYFGGRLTFEVTDATPKEGIVVDSKTIVTVAKQQAPEKPPTQQQTDKNKFIKEIVVKSSQVDWKDNLSVVDFILYLNGIVKD